VIQEEIDDKCRDIILKDKDKPKMGIDKILVYCTTYNCLVNEEQAIAECKTLKTNKINSLICDKMVFIIEKKYNSERDSGGPSCGIDFKPPVAPAIPFNPNIIKQWHKVVSLYSRGRGCMFDNWLRVFCDTEGCDEKPRKIMLSECFPEKTITFDGTNYVVGGNYINNRDDVKAACAVEIRVENGTILRFSSFAESGASSSSCSSVNSSTQSFIVLCNHYNCDKSMDSAELAEKCNVEFFP
ncbi:hypothetical protein PENTCL1PPCAC_2817, partial [Pristionchus entomophagus]